jgi:hypothetical protein
MLFIQSHAYKCQLVVSKHVLFFAIVLIFIGAFFRFRHGHGRDHRHAVGAGQIVLVGQCSKFLVARRIRPIAAHTTADRGGCGETRRCRGSIGWKLGPALAEGRFRTSSAESVGNHGHHLGTRSRRTMPRLILEDGQWLWARLGHHDGSKQSLSTPDKRSQSTEWRAAVAAVAITAVSAAGASAMGERAIGECGGAEDGSVGLVESLELPETDSRTKLLVCSR